MNRVEQLVMMIEQKKLRVQEIRDALPKKHRPAFDAALLRSSKTNLNVNASFIKSIERVQKGLKPAAIFFIDNSGADVRGAVTPGDIPPGILSKVIGSTEDGTHRIFAKDQKTLSALYWVERHKNTSRLLHAATGVFMGYPWESITRFLQSSVYTDRS